MVSPPLTEPTSHETSQRGSTAPVFQMLIDSSSSSTVGISSSSKKSSQVITIGSLGFITSIFCVGCMS
jgi:hypothetical protein